VKKEARVEKQEAKSQEARVKKQEDKKQEIRNERLKVILFSCIVPLL